MHFNTAFGSDLQPANPKDPKVPSALVDFIVDAPTFNAPPAESNDGIEVGVNIKFEPSALGDSRAIIVLSSPDSGEYQCLLIGQSSAPVPKGPFKINAKSAPIDFKNPFFDACEFVIRIDNPSFTTSAKSPVRVDVIINIFILFIYH